jgi:hypothetical protein
MAINTSIDAAYMKVVSDAFWLKAGQRGSYLLPFMNPVGVVGDSLDIRNTDIGNPTWMNSGTEPTNYTNQTYGCRTLMSHYFSEALIRGMPEVQKVATLDPSILVNLMWDKCGAFLDTTILYGKDGIGGLAGKARVKNLETDAGDYDYVDLPKSQYIFYDDVEYGVSNDIDNYDSIKYGLSTSKIIKAVEKCREKFQSSNLLCIANTHAQTSLIADPRAANLQWNVIPTMAINGIVSYGGVQNFVISEKVKKGIKTVKDDGDNTIVDHAYVVALDQVLLGVGTPIDFTISNSIDHSNAQVIFMWGAYDCLRMDENAVVCIEIKRGG